MNAESLKTAWKFSHTLFIVAVVQLNSSISMKMEMKRFITETA